MAWKNQGALLKLLSCALEPPKTKKFQGGKQQQAQSNKDTEFLCRLAGCKAADLGLPTRFGKMSCYWCGTPKNKAMNPPKHQTTPWKGDPAKHTGGWNGSAGKPTPATEKSTTKEVADATTDAANFFAPVPGGSPPEADEPQDLTQPKPQWERWQPRALDCLTIDGMNSFQEKWHAIVDSTTEDLFPTEEALPNAEAVVTELLASNKSLATVEEKAALQQEIKELRAQTAMGNPESEGNKNLMALLGQKEAQLDKKGTPSAELQHQSLVAAKGTWGMEKKTSLDRTTAGAQRAADRARERMSLLDQLENAMRTIRMEILNHDDLYNQAHAERADAIAEHNEKVSNLLDTKITAAKKAAEDATKTPRAASCAPTAQTEPPKAPNAKPIDTDQLTTALAQLEEMRAHSKALLEKIQELEKEKTGPTSEAASSTAMATDSTSNLTLTTTLGADDIFERADPALLPNHTPTDDAVGREQLTVCGHFHQLLQLWIQGGYLPVTFGELRAHSTAGFQVHNLMKDLLGLQLWDGWFEMLADIPDDSEMIPRQALTYCHIALERLREKHKVNEDVKEAATKSYASLSAAGKKRRAAATA